MKDVKSVLTGICQERGITLVDDLRVNTSNYGNGKDLVFGELLGGVILLPKQIDLRLDFINRGVKDAEAPDTIEKFVPRMGGYSQGYKVVFLPELFVLSFTDTPCNQIVDWARGEKCLVVPTEDTPSEFIQALHNTGDNFTILPTDSDRRTLISNAREVMCSTVGNESMVSWWLQKPFSFMKEGRPHDVGPFRLLNIVLSNDVANREQRLRNFLNSQYGGFLIPSRDGLTKLHDFLTYYEEHYEKSTYAHRT